MQTLCAPFDLRRQLCCQNLAEIGEVEKILARFSSFEIQLKMVTAYVETVGLIPSLPHVRDTNCVEEF
jgi:hypothetical protein